MDLPLKAFGWGRKSTNMSEISRNFSIRWFWQRLNNGKFPNGEKYRGRKLMPVIIITGNKYDHFYRWSIMCICIIKMLQVNLLYPNLKFLIKLKINNYSNWIKIMLYYCEIITVYEYITMLLTKYVYASNNQGGMACVEWHRARMYLSTKIAVFFQ